MFAKVSCSGRNFAVSASTEEKSEFVPFSLAVAERGVKGGKLLVN